MVAPFIFKPVAATTDSIRRVVCRFMNYEVLFIGVLLGAIPTAEAGRLAVALLAKKFGLEPKEIVAYNNAADGDPETD